VPNSFAVEVVSSAFQGNCLDVFGWVGNNKKEIRLQLGGRHRLCLGETIHVKLPNNGIRFLEAFV
jgi:hypothetical protein